MNEGDSAFSQLSEFKEVDNNQKILPEPFCFPNNAKWKNCKPVIWINEKLEMAKQILSELLSEGRDRYLYKFSGTLKPEIFSFHNVPQKRGTITFCECKG